MTPSKATRLVGRGELRKMFGVSHTRVVFLASQPDFPAPLDELSVGKIWALEDVLAWAERKGRSVDLAVLATDAGGGGDAGPPSTSGS